MFGLSAVKLAGLGAALALLAGLWGWHGHAVSAAHRRGAAEAEARCDAANVRAELAETKRQLAARDRVIAADRADEARREAELKTLEERTKAYADDIERLDAELAAADARQEGKPAAVVYRCRGDPDAARRLRDAWGG